MLTILRVSQVLGVLAVAFGLAAMPVRGDDPKRAESKPEDLPAGSLKPVGADLDLKVRQRRVLRWTMTFSTRTGAAYAEQLDALGAILAVPDREGNYLVIRDLKERPAKAEKVDLRTIKRIFWIDERPESVGPLAKTLQLQAEPAHVVAFFPESLEKELLAKEQKYRGLIESDILETRFRVIRRGDMHVIAIRSQRAVGDPEN